MQSKTHFSVLRDGEAFGCQKKPQGAGEESTKEAMDVCLRVSVHLGFRDWHLLHPELC